MKLPLLVAAYRRHERGELDLDAEVPVHNEHRSAYDGTPFSLDQDDDQDDETWARILDILDALLRSWPAAPPDGAALTLPRHPAPPEQDSP